MATTFEVQTDPIEFDPTKHVAVQSTFEIEPNEFPPPPPVTDTGV